MSDLKSELGLSDVPLGFGCASLLEQGRTPTEGERLIEAALDAGVRYFDTARMYGDGRAEAILGAVATRRREEMTLVSKAGIAPPSRALPVRLLRKGVELAGRAARPLRRVLRPPAASQPRFHAFSPAELTASVETSLRELRTDRLDALLLHEPAPADVTPELVATLQRLRAAGKVRFTGLAGDLDATNAIAASHPGLAQVVQIPSSTWTRDVARLRAPTSLVGVHSALGRRFQALAARLQEPDRRRVWEAQLAIDPGAPGALARLFLNHALSSNPEGFVLFSSTRPANIATNVAVARGPRLDAAGMHAFEALVRAEPHA